MSEQNEDNEWSLEHELASMSFKELSNIGDMLEKSTTYMLSIVGLSTSLLILQPNLIIKIFPIKYVGYCLIFLFFSAASGIIAKGFHLLSVSFREMSVRLTEQILRLIEQGQPFELNKEKYFALFIKRLPLYCRAMIWIFHQGKIKSRLPFEDAAKYALYQMLFWSLQFGFLLSAAAPYIYSIMTGDYYTQN